MIKRLIIILVGVFAVVGSVAATEAVTVDKKLFNHLDAGVTIGTSGVGLNLSVPVTDYVKVRAGVDYMPRFVVPMTFDIGTYQDIPEGVEDHAQWLDDHFKQVSDIMYQLSGIELDRKVKMRANGRMFDFKFLVDIYPWKEDKRWHFTVGFHLGSSKVMYTENDATVMPALMAMKIYNNFYDYVMKTDFIDEPIYNNIYLDPDLADKLKDKVADYGRLGVEFGKFKSDGSKFMMEPGKDGMVKATMFVNKFKPYIGFGYNAPLTRDGRWKFGFDAGLLLWGQPKLMSHKQPLVDENDLTITAPGPDGNEEVQYGSFDLINEVDHVVGKAGTYVGIASFLKVYPTINFKISFNIF